jgi:hypothetical protein
VLARIGERQSAAPSRDYADALGDQPLASADRLDGPQWRDVGPLDDAARAELDDRRARWADALAGKGWRSPLPMC